METSQALPAGAVAADDLAAVAAGTPPFVSLFLHTEGDVEDAGQRSDLRWRNLRDELETQGAPSEVLDRIGSLVPDAHRRGDGLGVVADAGGLRLVDHGPLQQPDDVGLVGPVPRLLPFVRWRQEEPTAVVVLTDRRGADLFALRREAPDLEGSVEGDDHPLRKVGPGGWSQRRFQERAENTWERNAEDVARAVERLCARVEPRVVVVAGDVRAVTLLQESLADEVRAIVEVVPGERPWEGIGDAIPDEVGEVVGAAVRRDGDGLLARLREEVGQRDLGVAGLGSTAEALAAARAAVLLVAEPAGSLWVGPEPLLVAATPARLRELGVEDPTEVSAADAAVRAALAGGAAVRAYDVRDPDGPSGTREPPDAGLGALLRWSDGGPPA